MPLACCALMPCTHAAAVLPPPPPQHFMLQRQQELEGGYLQAQQAAAAAAAGTPGFPPAGYPGALGSGLSRAAARVTGGCCARCCAEAALPRLPPCPPASPASPAPLPLPPAEARPDPMRDCILLCACGDAELLPQNPDLPADTFTSCLTTPIKARQPAGCRALARRPASAAAPLLRSSGVLLLVAALTAARRPAAHPAAAQVALRWFCSRSLLRHEGITKELIDRIPGKQTDRKTPLGACLECCRSCVLSSCCAAAGGAAPRAGRTNRLQPPAPLPPS